MVRQQEAVHGQQAILSKPELTPIQTFSSRRPAKRHGNSHSRQSQATTPRPQPGQKCSYCGKGPHPKQSCPARQVICHKCNKKGQYSTVCRSKAVATVSEEQLENNSFLDTIQETIQDTIQEVEGTSWIATIKINRQEIVFKLDTGAEATAISTRTYNILKNITLQKSGKVLCGPNNKPLDVLGQAVVQLTYEGRTCKQPIYITEGLKNNLLGLPAITALQLLTKVESIQPGNVQKRLFQGLGTLKGDYQIQLKPDAKPYALYTARNVPIRLRTKVKQV